ADLSLGGSLWRRGSKNGLWNHSKGEQRRRVGWRSNSRRLPMPAFGDDRFKSRWYVESSARARLAPSAAFFDGDGLRNARSGPGGNPGKRGEKFGSCSSVSSALRRRSALRSAPAANVRSR